MNFLLIKDIDKANHFIVGFLIYFISFIFLGTWLSVIPVILFAGAKEALDMFYRKLPFDYKDFLFTIAGMLPILITHLV
jgi:hypothetical protein